MHRLVTGLVVVLVLVGSGACGTSDRSSPGTRADTSTEPTAPTTDEPTAAYFVQADSDAINAVAAPVQQAAAVALDAERSARCNRAGQRGYRAWRACWHDLLDPFSAALGELARELGAVAGQDLPEDCVSGLEDARAVVTGLRRQVDGLRAGIDSDRRAAQKRALLRYQRTLESAARGYVEPFQALTQACYSPQDLASINATPSPSP